MVAGTSHIPAKVKALPYEGASVLWYCGCSVAVLDHVKLLYMLYFILSVWMGLCSPTWQSNCTFDQQQLLCGNSPSFCLLYNE